MQGMWVDIAANKENNLTDMNCMLINHYSFGNVSMEHKPCNDLVQLKLKENIHLDRLNSK